MITELQRTLRQKYIGASDAPAICGVDPYASPADVWLVKTGRADSFAGNEDTERGNLLEPVVLSWAETQLNGAAILRNHFVKNEDYPSLCANLDGVVAAESAVVEAKTTVNADQWGEPGTDHIPDRVIVQVHQQMLLMGKAWTMAYVPVLLPGYRSFDFRMYRVERDDKLAEAIGARCMEFWDRFIVTDTRPDDFKPSIEVLKRVRREPNKTVPVSEAALDAFIVTRAARLQAEENEEKAKAAVLVELLDAEHGECEDGREVTYMETKRKGYVVEDTTYRTLRVKTPKEKR